MALLLVLALAALVIAVAAILVYVDFTRLDSAQADIQSTKERLDELDAQVQAIEDDLKRAGFERYGGQQLKADPSVGELRRT